MTMVRRIGSLLGLVRAHPRAAQRPKLIITHACVRALSESVAPEREKGHEGVAYLLGRTDGVTTLAVTAIRPEAHTTQGSFHVDPRAMARVVRAAANLGLQVVCQVHTHPGRAYHSDGDVEGARIRYAGFTSVVLPDYGRRLPRFDGAAIYMLGTDDCWVDLNPDELIIAPENAS